MSGSLDQESSSLPHRPALPHSSPLTMGGAASRCAPWAIASLTKQLGRSFLYKCFPPFFLLIIGTLQLKIVSCHHPCFSLPDSLPVLHKGDHFGLPRQLYDALCWYLASSLKEESYKSFALAIMGFWSSAKVEVSRENMQSLSRKHSSQEWQTAYVFLHNPRPVSFAVIYKKYFNVFGMFSL